jgi:hypothetical protein
MENHHKEKIHILELRVIDLDKKINRILHSAAKINAWTIQELYRNQADNLKKLKLSKHKYIHLRSLVYSTKNSFLKFILKRKLAKCEQEYYSLLQDDKKYRNDLILAKKYIPEQDYYNEELDSLVMKKYNAIQEIDYITSHYL